MSKLGGYTELYADGNEKTARAMDTRESRQGHGL